MMYQVLIVDDEEIVCRGLTEFIKWKEHGFEVAGTANNVDDGLALLKILSVNVIFLDIRMPDKSGLTMLPILKEKYPDIRVVILSGYSDFSYAREALRYSVRDYLTKPVSLSEMEALLERLQEELDQQQRELQVQASYTHNLLLSMAKGYTKADSQTPVLPTLQSWFGLSISLLERRLTEAALSEKKHSMKKQITSVFPNAIVLDPDVFSLFFLIPCGSEKDFETFLSMLEQLCPQLSEWACGASEWKNGIQALPDAWREAEQALRYHRAGNRKEITRYQNIKILLAQYLPELDHVLSNALQRLTDASSRADVIPYVQEFLVATCRNNYTLIQYQTICIRFLFELNGRLVNLNLPEVNFRTDLNQSLSNLLLCDNYQGAIDCVLDYVKRIIEQLNQPDEQQLVKGIIWEIQVYIRQHYDENISLHTLSEHFYLHPNYLSKLFKDKTGKTFIEYLTQVRMEKAKELLQNTHYKVVEICSMIGYDNPRYFSKLFKKYAGMIPAEYRKNL